MDWKLSNIMELGNVLVANRLQMYMEQWYFYLQINNNRELHSPIAKCGNTVYLECLQI